MKKRSKTRDMKAEAGAVCGSSELSGGVCVEVAGSGNGSAK